MTDNPTVERTAEDVGTAIRTIFPHAVVEGDDDGELIIHTGCYFTGKNGEAVIGPMNVEGETP